MGSFKKSALVSTIKIIINLLYGLTIAGVVIVSIGSVMVLVNPESQTFNTFDLLSVIYDVDLDNANNIENQIISSPDLRNAELKLHASFDFNLGSNWLGVSLYFLFIVIMAGGFIILRMLKKIMLSLEENNFFTTENAKRIRIIGFTIISIQLILIFSALFSVYYFDGLVSSPYFSISLNLEYLTNVIDEFIGQIFTGVIIILLAEIFKVAAKMKQEQELTV